jgi:hypothetical protein
VADGRDIGTVVFPDAELKAFLVADPEERARRRLRERGEAAADAGQVRAEAARLLGRDAIDSGRAAAPLRQAEDAVVIDTTHLDFDEQVERIVRLARERGGLDRGANPVTCSVSPGYRVRQPFTPIHRRPRTRRADEFRRHPTPCPTRPRPSSTRPPRTKAPSPWRSSPAAWGAS